MGATLTFKFSFDSHEGFPPAAVRIWVDEDNHFAPAPGDEVTLTANGLEWTGTFELGAATSAGVWYLVGYAGSVGASFTLEVRSDAPKDHAVATGGGAVKHLRDTFWGMCSP